MAWISTHILGRRPFLHQTILKTYNHQHHQQSQQQQQSQQVRHYAKPHHKPSPPTSPSNITHSTASTDFAHTLGNLLFADPHTDLPSIVGSSTIGSSTTRSPTAGGKISSNTTPPLTGIPHREISAFESRDRLRHVTTALLDSLAGPRGGTASLVACARDLVRSGVADWGTVLTATARLVTHKHVSRPDLILRLIPSSLSASLHRQHYTHKETNSHQQQKHGQDELLTDEHVERTTLVVALSALAQVRAHPDHAWLLLERLRQQSRFAAAHLRDGSVATALLRVCSRGDSTGDSTLATLHSLRAHWRPDPLPSAACHAALYGLARHVHPATHTAAGCPALARLALVLRTMLDPRQMPEGMPNIVLDRPTARIILLAAARARAPDLALIWLHRMRSIAYMPPLPSPLLDSRAYSADTESIDPLTLLRPWEHARLHTIAEADLLRALPTKPPAAVCPPDTATHNLVLLALARTGRLDDASLLLECMWSHSPSPSNLKSSHTEHESHGIRMHPDAASYATILAAGAPHMSLPRADNFLQDALHRFDSTSAKSTDLIDSEGWRRILHAYLVVCRTNKLIGPALAVVEKLRPNIESLDPAAYTLLLQTAARAGRADLLEAVWTQMMERDGLAPTRGALHAVLSYTLHPRRLPIALRISSTAAAFAIFPDTNRMVRLADVARVHADTRLAQECIRQLSTHPDAPHRLEMWLTRLCHGSPKHRLDILPDVLQAAVDNKVRFASARYVQLWGILPPPKSGPLAELLAKCAPDAHAFHSDNVGHQHNSSDPINGFKRNGLLDADATRDLQRDLLDTLDSATDLSQDPVLAKELASHVQLQQDWDDDLDQSLSRQSNPKKAQDDEMDD